MELFTDLRKRLPFGAGGARAGDPRAEMWERLVASDELLVAAIDRSGKIQSANESLSQTREGEVVGTSLFYLVNAEDRSAFVDLVRAAFAGAPGGAGQARLLTAGDRSPAVHWVLLPVPHRDGSVEEVYCLGMDLSSSLEGSAPGAGVEELARFREMAAGLERENIVLRKELEQRAVAQPLLGSGAAESESQLPAGPVLGLEEGEQAPTLAELERRYIVHTLEETAGRVSGAKGAAAILGLHPNTLRSRMAKLGIERRV
jgi:hypothetical protein